jgi:thiamine-phosphate pyrophosphorylase
LIRYLITDPKEYSSNIDIFRENLTNVLSNKDIDFVCFRDKVSDNFRELAKASVEISSKYNKKLMINSNYTLAKELGAYGVHLTSTQFDKIALCKSMNLFVVVSTHTKDEILLAQEYGADMVTYSPIFYTPNKGTPKGIKELDKVAKDVDINLLALGGIVSDEHISQIKSTSAIGFASIRYFVS